jgi:3-phosphoshikimate 1-carboxyvinyltransferase
VADNIPVIRIPGSKSISNRLLILQALYPGIRIENLSTARDTQLLRKALTSQDNIIDVMDAGTAMRFATAFFAATTKRRIVLTGTGRMKNRPVKPLVNALLSIGASIRYLEKEGYPPLEIVPAGITGNRVNIEADVSSQFISALMLIAPALPGGLGIAFDKRDSVSQPYWRMTLELLKRAGAEVDETGNEIYIYPPDKALDKHFTVESDWSSASYFYSAVAVTGKTLCLERLYADSLQGDAVSVRLFEKLGVHTEFQTDGRVLISKKMTDLPASFEADCTDCPDLAQTLAVTCFALKIPCKLTGLQTLRIKETDRIDALRNELRKLGATVQTGGDWLHIIPPAEFPAFDGEIETYADHRMSMSFAVLSLLFPEMKIKDKQNVVKSYPGFWDDWDKI